MRKEILLQTEIYLFKLANTEFCRNDFPHAYLSLPGWNILSLKLRYLNLKTIIRDIRMLAIIGIAEAGSGLPGASLSTAEIMGSL